MKEKQTYRQWDVLLLKIDTLPKGARALAPADRYILAEGEATGHHHGIDAVEGLTVLTKKRTNELYVTVEETPATLTHQEHAPIKIPLGFYEVRRQREYDPEEGSRHVLD